MSSKMTFIDLFCGMGGFRIAFENNGCECVFSSDIDKFARKTYELNFNDVPSGDITKISAKEIPTFNILCGGFPCQPFSIAGKRKGFYDTRGTLFFDVARILKEKQPDAFFLENVKGLVNHNKGETLKVIISTLKKLGYYVEWKVLNAKDFGVPQNRERWYCVGFNKSKPFYSKNKCFEWPKEIPLKFDLSKIIKNVEDDNYSISERCKHNIKINLKDKKINNLTLAYEIRPSRCQFANNKISPCLTAKMGTGGNNVPVVIKQNRRLTEKECLKIMGFPNKYKIYKGNHTYKQIGNSVVVPVLEMIALEMLKYIKEK